MKHLRLIPLLLLFSCTSDNVFEKGKKTLTAQGYSEIKSTGYELFCCSEEDLFTNGFTAKSKSGETVTGCFCGGIMKAVTIRYN